MGKVLWSHKSQMSLVSSSHLWKVLKNLEFTVGDRLVSPPFVAPSRRPRGSRWWWRRCWTWDRYTPFWPCLGAPSVPWCPEACPPEDVIRSSTLASVTGWPGHTGITLQSHNDCFDKQYEYQKSWLSCQILSSPHTARITSTGAMRGCTYRKERSPQQRDATALKVGSRRQYVSGHCVLLGASTSNSILQI